MTIGKILALIILSGVLSSPRVHGVVIDTTSLAKGSGYEKIHALIMRGVIFNIATQDVPYYTHAAVRGRVESAHD